MKWSQPHFKQNFVFLKTEKVHFPCHLRESSYIFRGIRGYVSFSFHFSMKLMTANRIAPNGTLRFAASHLGLFCLPMANKKVRL